nr:hypothetical protein [Malaciobacter halophilus]
MLNLQKKYEKFMNEQRQLHILGTKLIENELNENGIDFLQWAKKIL